MPRTPVKIPEEIPYKKVTTILDRSTFNRAVDLVNRNNDEQLGGPRSITDLMMAAVTEYLDRADAAEDAIGRGHAVRAADGSAVFASQGQAPSMWDYQGGAR